jgi:hypothetical protein
MTNKTQNILILAITAFMIVLVIVWFTVLNKGTVAITTGVTDYSVTINNVVIPCETDPCSIKSKIGTYGLIFNKEGYNSVSAKVEVARWKVTDVALKPKKKVEVMPSVVVPKTEEDILPVLPADLNAENTMYPVWHADGRIIFIDKSDERLKIRNTDGKIRPVTIFKNITPPVMDFYWSGDGARVIGSQVGDLYFVDVEQGSRKKQILEFVPANITWSPKSDFILVDDGADNVYKIDWNNREPAKLESGFKLSQSKWIDDTTLLIYSIDIKNNKTSVWTLDPSSGITETLVEKYDFPVSEMVYDKEAGKAYLRNSKESAWYEINLL